MIIDTSKCESLEEVEKCYGWDKIYDPKFPGAKVYQGTFERYLDSWMKALKKENQRLQKEYNELKLLYDSSYAVMRAYLICALGDKKSTPDYQRAISDILFKMKDVFSSQLCEDDIKNNKGE